MGDGAAYAQNMVYTEGKATKLMRQSSLFHDTERLTKHKIDTTAIKFLGGPSQSLVVRIGSQEDKLGPGATSTQLIATQMPMVVVFVEGHPESKLSIPLASFEGEGALEISIVSMTGDSGDIALVMPAYKVGDTVVQLPDEIRRLPGEEDPVKKIFIFSVSFRARIHLSQDGMFCISSKKIYAFPLG